MVPSLRRGRCCCFLVALALVLASVPPRAAGASVVVSQNRAEGATLGWYSRKLPGVGGSRRISASTCFRRSRSHQRRRAPTTSRQDLQSLLQVEKRPSAASGVFVPRHQSGGTVIGRATWEPNISPPRGPNRLARPLQRSRGSPPLKSQGGRPPAAPGESAAPPPSRPRAPGRTCRRR